MNLDRYYKMIQNDDLSKRELGEAIEDLLEEIERLDRENDRLSRELEAHHVGEIG